MESESLKVLFIGSDENFARAIAGMLQEAGGTIQTDFVPTLEAGFVTLKKNSFDAILFELPTANTAGLFQATSLAIKAQRVPVIVFGSATDEAFAVEAVRAGAQDYLAKEHLDAQALQRAIRCAIERQQERIVLINEKENYHSVFDHLVEGIFRTTPDGHYLLANIALARIYGYNSPVELMASITDIGRNLYVKPERREEFVRLMQQNDTLTGFESEIYRKDGDTIWISENCRAVRDAQGKLLYYEGTVEDITHRLQTEMSLRNSESLYHSLVETMPQNVFRKDLEGRFTFANQQYCNHYHCRLEDILGKTDFDFFPKELAEKYERDDKRVIETGQTSEITEEHQPLGQEKTFVQVVKTPLYGVDGRIVGLQGIFWDITEKKRADELIRRTSAELSRSREELRAKNLAMEENLRMAREVQLAMILQQYPTFPHNLPPEQSAFQFAHRYHPAETIGGDFFSVSALSETEAGVFICDVTGHGVRSSLVTAMIRALVEELKPLAHDPGMFLRKLNSDLFKILKNTGSPILTTAFYFVADCQTGVMRFANAGHPKPLHIRRRADQVELLRNAAGKSQPALGLFDDPQYQTTETTLEPGDLVMLFTDGLYEVQGPNEELYSQERLLLDVKSRAQKPAAVLFDELLESIRAFSVDHEFEDDVCLVGMDFVGKPSPKKS
ncbi:MAG TPA: SpoIIE family protein phosphatase [Verrucomicrobiae bacterium]|jgi:sigma-B regulation protein RsbU (phosphoserine phosphatase)